MKALVLTEKPSQGKEVAAGLGESFTKADGYLESKNFIVSWAIGHLVELADPGAYDPKYAEKLWVFEALPILPDKWKYTLKENTKKQFSTIKELLQRADVDRVIEAGDPGREGELISRLILNLAGNKKPTFRFWVTMALDQKTVQAGMKALKPASQYDGLYKSASARQKADWVVGMNATRAMSIKFRGLVSVGRVQTPTLAMVVHREKEIVNFKPLTYWIIQAIFKHKNGEYTGIWVPELVSKEEKDKQEDTEDVEDSYRIKSKEQAEAMTKACVGQKGQIVKIESKREEKPPALLYSLTDLQIAANKILGISAEDTLAAAQELYETYKAISYPRTESNHLSTNLISEVPQILQKLKSVITFDIKKCNVNGGNKRIFDDTKFTDHHAIIPTGHIPKVSDNSKDVYELICKRFVSAFHPNLLTLKTVVYTVVANNLFQTKGSVILDEGWSAITGLPEQTQIPEMAEKDAVDVSKVRFNEKKTTPKSRFTESTLLSAMKNIAKYVEDERYKKILRDVSGIGTPATRAEIIKKLKDRYLVVMKKHLHPNEKAIKLIEALEHNPLIDPMYTAQMEQELEDIAYKGKSAEGYMTSIYDFAKKFVAWSAQLVISSVPSSKHNIIGKCPLCKGNVYANDKAFSCEKTISKECEYTIWRNSLKNFGRASITEKEGTALIQGKEVPFEIVWKDKKYSVLGSVERWEKGYRIKLEKWKQI